MSQYQQEDALGMSDEDFSSLNVETAFADRDEPAAEGDERQASASNEGSDAEGTPAGGVEGEEHDESLTQQKESSEGQADESGDEEEQEAEEQEEEGQSADADEGDKADEGSEEGDDDGQEEEGDEGEDDDAQATAAKDFYERVTAPFKANGQEMQFKDPDDVIRLMQMGANYNKKMAALKPALKVVKMLERNKLMDEDRLSFLIDVEKKDPKAIAKLLKDSELDPMDLDLEEGQNYKPSKKHSVDDREIALDNMIEELKDSPTYSKTIDVVSNKWDDESRNIVANTPELMRVIDDHIQSGVYEVISTEVEKERTLGRLNGLPAIEAYRQVGDRLYQQGAFDHLKQGKEKPAETQSKPAPQAKPNPKADDSQRRAKRRAASPSKKAPTPSKTQDFNPLSMSDEDFEKQYDGRLL